MVPTFYFCVLRSSDIVVRKKRAWHGKRKCTSGTRKRKSVISSEWYYIDDNFRKRLQKQLIKFSFYKKKGKAAQCQSAFKAALEYTSDAEQFRKAPTN